MATRTVVAPNAELALDHLVSAQDALGHDNVGPNLSVAPDYYEDDPRYGFLIAAEFQWGATDLRWKAAKALILHDQYPDAALRTETLGLLVRIVDLAEELTTDVESGPRSDVDEVRREARELRDATERLHRIVDAVTALPLLGEVR